MPPRRNQPRPNYADVETEDENSDAGSDFDPTLIIEEVKPELKLCSQHLSKIFFEMCQELKKDLECVICTEKLDCKCCFEILSCGHYFHSGCLLRLKTRECSICKDHYLKN